MGLSDYFIKKEEERKNQQIAIPSAGPVNNEMPETNVFSPTPTVSSRIENGEDPLTVILDKNYKESKESLERQRKMDFFGQIAKVAAQTGASIAGARQFKPVESNTQSYTAALDRLRDNYNSTRLNLTLAEQRKKIEQQRWEYEQAKKAEAERQKQENWKATYDFGVEKHKDDKAHKADTLGQGDARIAETIRHNKATEGIGHTNAAVAARNATSNEKRADAAAVAAGKKNTGSESNVRSIVITNENGERVSVNYPKTKDGSIISLYNRMRTLSESNPEKYGSKLDDINLQFGEGGDQSTKAMTIIQRRLQDFPELTEEFYSIIGDEPTKKSIDGFGTSNKKKVEGF